MPFELTSAQEAALNAFAEVARDFHEQGINRFSASVYMKDGNFFVHVDTPDGDNTVGGSGRDLPEAGRKMVAELNKYVQDPKPKPLSKPSKVKAAAIQLVDGYREKHSDYSEEIEELSSQLAALDVRD